MLLHITKELSTGRIMRTRQNLQAATPEMLSVLRHIYNAQFQAWQSQLGALDNDCQTRMEQSLLAMKVIRRLLVAGYEHPNRNDEVHEIWSLTIDHVRKLIDMLAQGRTHYPPIFTVLIEKHLLQLAKLHLEMAKTHPAAFVLLPDSIDLVRAYWGMIRQFAETFGAPSAVISAVKSARLGEDEDQGDEKSILEKLSLKGLLLIRACVKMVFNPAQTFKYPHPKDKEEKAQAEVMVKNGLLTEDFVKEVMNVIVTKFFVFRDTDLREWEEDPEEWERVVEGESEGFEFSIRPCSEKLFLDLAIHFRGLLVQPLLEVFGTVASK